jgi:3-hydroxyacyl-CoA dehydrogenase
LKNITILGAGTMGKGIALSFALAGYPVNLFDTQQAAREQYLRYFRTDYGIETCHRKDR